MFLLLAHGCFPPFIASQLLADPLALAVAFGGGGLTQFCIGVPLSTDLVAGYLIGASTACFAIGLLLRSEPRKGIS